MAGTSDLNVPARTDASAGRSEPFSLPRHLFELQEDARRLASRFGERHREVRRHPIEHQALHPELWGEVSDRGWPGMLVPPEHGGSGAGLLAYVLVMEALAAENLVLWMPVLTAAIGHAIAAAGPAPPRERWLEPIASGQALLALAVTEPECGHNVFRTRTTVRPGGSGFVLDGVKAVTSGLELADRILVFGRVPRESDGAPARYTTILVDPDAAGVRRIELPMGCREGVRQWRLELEQVEVGSEALVGEAGQGLLILWPITHVERLLTAALAVGNARYCLDRALNRARERTIFGQRPIGAEQAIAHPLARLHARLEATRLLVYRAAAAFDACADPIASAGEANMAKLLSADLLFDAADHAVQTLGAAAWDEREGLSELFLDARLARSAPVSQELALNFVAQHVLGLPGSR